MIQRRDRWAFATADAAVMAKNDSGQRMRADRERHDSDSPRARNNREHQVGVLPSTGQVFTTHATSLHRCLTRGSAGSAPSLEAITSLVILEITKLRGDYGLRTDGGRQVGLTRIGMFLSPPRD